MFDFDGVGGPDLLRRSIRFERSQPTTSWVELWSSGGTSLLWLRASDSQNDLFGFGATASGDINLDGVADVIVGAPFSDAGGPHSGAAVVLSGLDGSTIRTFAGAAAGRLSGTSVAGLGDLNGDGVPEVAATCSSLEATGRRGGVYVYSGTNGATLAQYWSPQIGDQFGRLLKSVPDVTGDGKPDLAIVSKHRLVGSVYKTVVTVVNPYGGTAVLKQATIGEENMCVIDVAGVAGSTTKLDVFTQKNTSTGREYSITRVTLATALPPPGPLSQSQTKSPEDVNGDSRIDAEDLDIVSNEIGATVSAPTLVNPDVDGDGVVTGADYQAVAAASSTTPVTALSAFALNELARMDERLPAMFRTVGITLSEEETAIVVTEEECETIGDTTPCGTGQRRDCADVCCGPGTWKFVSTGGPGAKQTSGDTPNKTSEPTRQGGRATVSDTLPHTSGLNVYASSGTADASWSSSDDATWSDPTTTPCSRRVALTATGSGSESVAVSVAAVVGVSASASTSGSGSCQSLGDASADMTMTPIGLSASVTSTSGSASVNFEGNFGILTADDNPSISGKFAAHQTATQTGGGSKTGSASYHVKTGRTFTNACYADPFSKIYAGTVGAVGTGESTGDPVNNEYCTYNASASMNLNIFGGP